MNWFSKKKAITILFFLCSVYFIVLTNSPSEGPASGANVVQFLVYPVKNVVNFFSESWHKSVVYFRDLEEVTAEKEALQSKVDELEKFRSEYDGMIQKNRQLREAMQLKNRLDQFELQGGNVISNPSGNWFSVFSVDIGRREGVLDDMAVVGSRGLVGRVLNAGMYTSEVISILDMDSSVSVRLSKKRTLAIFKGDIVLKDLGKGKLVYISEDTGVSYGDRVETSGLGGVFPPNIPVGEIVEVRQSDNEFTKYSVIKPFTDFNQLEEIYVLKPRSSEGDELEE